ncbi:type-F conjugative transfer system pilin assembly protein TrbC [Rickettsiales endosymbiont of Trichoplax sp. H2]|uniref:type-F conjugative transfer system pilin assembly protein TrbC n=1 Tax=Rickettsiales endosymbiont of Trichoplax sp. H2 TaxID=2021221 RepID=UPI0012B3517C|nr:type-F conjugative transfer system pilin assembly protein TrbC [Rickettsiales endosymbiont of Trichoplax sp. H2]MSO14472.1 hypothetical protein [Rickettsiales endosymbiont of Trichoplax sp. H2]
MQRIKRIRNKVFMAIIFMLLQVSLVGAEGLEHLNKEMADKQLIAKVKLYEKDVSEIKKSINSAKINQYKKDADQMGSEAEKLKKAAIDKHSDIFGDIKEFKRKTGNIRNRLGVKEGRRYVFLSFSMPSKVLESYFKESVVTGYLPVFRGLLEGSYKKTIAYLKPMMEATNAGAEINPEVFKEFNIKVVPSFVLSEGKLNCFEESSCESGKYNKIAGNIGIAEADKELLQKGEKW